MKFNGVTMLGGVTMNGDSIYQAAQAEIELLEEHALEKIAAVRINIQKNKKAAPNNNCII